ncbi:TIM barrel protein [bacterium]|nr:TIM barrel protein [bacterium]
MFNGGLVSISFRKLTPAEIVKLVAKSGLKCIEWGGDVHVPHGDTAIAREVAGKTTNAGLAVSSYGSYYQVAASEADGLSFEKVLDSAKALNAPIIRVWAGNRGSAEADKDYRKYVVDESARIAELAQAADIKVAYEYHGNTLTDTNASAQALLKAVDHPNMLTYWQPPNKRSVEYCLEGLQALLPQVIGLHIFSWLFNENDRSLLPLADGADWWEKYLTAAAKIPGEIPAMLEFVKGDEPEQFLEDAETLKKWLKRIQA